MITSGASQYAPVFRDSCRGPSAVFSQTSLIDGPTPLLISPSEHGTIIPLTDDHSTALVYRAVAAAQLIDSAYMGRPYLLALLTLAAMQAQDNLVLPANYREWIFLSSGLGMTYGPLAAPDAQPRFDNVFVSRPAYDAFLKSGMWPDKTTFILEVRAAESKGSINNGGHYQSEVLGIEAEVKEAGKWTFYGFGSAGTEVEPFPRTESCYSCHAQNGAVDNTFVQFYPTLLPVAKEKGTLHVNGAK